MTMLAVKTILAILLLAVNVNSAEILMTNNLSLIHIYPHHEYFLQSDLAEFAPYRTNMDGLTVSLSRLVRYGANSARSLWRDVYKRQLEKLYPDPNTEIIMYCGGGFRSALTCEAARKMGYGKVHSLIGGYKGLAAAGWPMAK